MSIDLTKTFGISFRVAYKGALCAEVEVFLYRHVGIVRYILFEKIYPGLYRHSRIIRCEGRATVGYALKVATFDV